MKKSIFKMVLSLFLILLTIEVNAQQNFFVVFKMPPPGTLNLNDLYNITVTNNSGSDLSGYLVGTAKEDKDGMIAKGTTVPIMFKKGLNNIKIKDLPKTPDVEYIASDPRYKESLIRQGKFPSGKYEICVKVMSSATNEELGSDCINQEVLETGLLTLINPANGEDIDSKVPITFTWSSGGKIPEGGYTLKICEVMENQTPETAMKSNKAWFEKKGIHSTTFAYPNSAKGFEEGKGYAWMVINGSTVSSINLFKVATQNNYTIDFTNLVCTNTPGRYDFEIKITVAANHGYDPVKVMAIPDISIYGSTPTVSGITFSYTNTFPIIIPRPGTGTISGSFQTAGGVSITQIHLQVHNIHFFSSTSYVNHTDDLVSNTIINNCSPPPTTTCKTCPKGNKTGPQLVTNGDFTAGNTGFTHPGINFVTAGGIVSGQYTITNNASLQNGYFCSNDHTNGLGKFLVCDGIINGPTTVWQRLNIAVTPNTNYVFCAWFRNLICAPTDFPDPVMEVKINGNTVATITPTETQLWVPVSIIWNSGLNPTATLEIIMTGTGKNGRDIGVDDISFNACLVPSAIMTCMTCPSGAPPIGPTLVSNGDFNNLPGSAGINSTANFVVGALSAQNTYTITTNAHLQNGLFCAQDRTAPGTGQFLACDGNPGGPTRVWEQTVNVTPNTNYVFCAWFKNLFCPPNNGSDPIMELRINCPPSTGLPTAGITVATITPLEADLWNPASGTWNSGGNTSATIRIVITNSIGWGNDIGVDDISFAACDSPPPPPPPLQAACQTCPTGIPTPGPQLVTNGDFTAGNTGFTHPGINFVTAGGIVSGQYTITNNANLQNGFFCSNDHTSTNGTGMFLVCDGLINGPTTVWQSLNIAVTPNTNYVFCAWFRNLICAPTNFPDPVMEVKINGNTVATITPTETQLWVPVSIIWNSVLNTTATLEIIMTGTGKNGRDIGVDDISFNACTKPPPSCTCGTWNQVTLQQGSGSSGINVTLPVVNRQVVFNQTLSSTLPITLIPVYNCNPTSCNATYEWRSFYPGPPVYSTSTPISFNYSAPGTLRMFTIQSRCGTNTCDTVNVQVWRQ